GCPHPAGEYARRPSPKGRGECSGRLLACTALGISALIAFVGCEWPGSAKAAPPAPPPKPPSRQFPVDVQKVSVMPLKYEIQALGSVEAQDVYQAHALVPGTLYDVTFNEGDTVKKE